MRILLLVFLSVLVPALVAAPVSANNVVLEIQEQDIYIDMGHDDGLALGSLVTLQHVIRAVHPVTKEKVRDTFPLGQMRVVNVGPKTAVVHADPRLFQRIRIGDEVTIASAPVTHVDPWTRPAVNPAQGPATDTQADWEGALLRAKDRIAAEQRVQDVWLATLGQSLDRRLELWTGFAAQNPDSPFLGVVQRSIRELTARIVAETALAKVSPQERRTNAALRQLSILGRSTFEEGALAQHAPTRSYEGEPIALALLVPDASRIDKAWLYYRQSGESSYEVRPMGLDGDGYLRGQIPGTSALAPGVEYFIEILETGGLDPYAALGHSARPERVTVDASVEEEEPDRVGHSRVTLFTDYVDFDGPSTSFDQYIHAEVDFMYRFFQPIYSLRLGFGTMAGTGGPKDVIDLGEGCTIGGEYRCRKVGYNYAFTEIEERFTDIFAVMVRLQWGSAYQDRGPMEGVDREFFDAFGVRGRVRLGRELESNLVLGVSTTQRLGSMYEGAFTWDVIPRFPVVLAVQVTDQPVLEDFGVRLISDVGWRHFDWVYPSLRIAYQARDIDHAGLSAGLAANFDW